MQKDITIPSNYKRNTLLDFLLKNLTVYEYEKAIKELPKKCGVSPSALSQWRTDTRSISTKHLDTIATYFNVTVDQLLMRESKAA